MLGMHWEVVKLVGPDLQVSAFVAPVRCRGAWGVATASPATRFDRGMSTNERRGTETRYGHGQTSAGGGRDDQGGRKDEAWQSRQGGGQSRAAGSRGEPRATPAGEPAGGSHQPPG